MFVVPRPRMLVQFALVVSVLNIVVCGSADIYQLRLADSILSYYTSAAVCSCRLFWQFCFWQKLGILEENECLEDQTLFDIVFKNSEHLFVNVQTAL